MYVQFQLPRLQATKINQLIHCFLKNMINNWVTSLSVQQLCQQVEALEGGNGGTGSAGIGKKNIILLKGKEKEIPNVSGGPLLQQNTVSPEKASHSPAPSKQNQQLEASGRIIWSILLSRDTRQNQPSLGSLSELRIQSPNQEKDKKPPRPPSLQLLQKDINGAPYVVSNDVHAVPTGKQERRARNKDRPDRGVWTPL